MFSEVYILEADKAVITGDFHPLIPPLSKRNLELGASRVRARVRLEQKGAKVGLDGALATFDGLPSTSPFEQSGLAHGAVQNRVYMRTKH